MTNPRRSPIGTALTLVWLVVLAGFGSAAASQETSPAAAPQDDADSHRRMVAALRDVAHRSELENPYLGSGLLSEYRARLAELGESGPAAARTELLHAIGQIELQRGDVEQAIADLGRALELATASPSETAREDRVRVTYELALAYLRLAETQNCVQHHADQSCLLPIRGNGVHVEKAAARQAIVHLAQVLELAEPGTAPALSARWLLNLASMAVGEYPEGVPAEHLIQPSAFDSDVPFPRFPDVATQRGVAPFDLSGGALAEDFDGDGRVDLLTSTWNPSGALHLYLGADGGSFEERTEASGLAGITGGLNMVQADYDGDGDVDVLVLRGAWLGEFGCQPNSLLRNDGGGRFTDVTFAAGLGEEHYPTQAAAWADYDGDGDLDLYVGNEATLELRYPGQLFRNEGDGTFRDRARAMRVTNLRYAKGVTWGDYDGDGRMDLYVSNLGAKNRLYRNTGEGFRDVAEELGVHKPLDSFPAWFWDYDNDGALDLYVSCYDQGSRSGNQGAFRLSALVATYVGERPRSQRARLYRGDGEGGFTDVSRATGMNRVTLTMGANFGDLDNDGFLDVYLGTGYPHYDGLVPNVMLKNDRGQRFLDVTTSGGFGHLQKGHGVVFADLDRDGDQDVYEQLGGAYPGDAYSNVFFENPGFENHWLGLQLRGVRSNRFGIGARVRVDIVEGGEPRSIHRTLPNSGSFGGNPFELHIGLGSAERVERLEVFWPTSGARQVFEGLEVDRRIRVTEDRAEPEMVEVATPSAER